LAIIFLWTSGNLFHVAWQGNFQQWVLNPLKVRPVAHAIWDPHFGNSAIKAFTRLGLDYPANIATSGVYHWWYTIGMRTNIDLYYAALSLLLLSSLCLAAGWLHLQPKFMPHLAGFKNAEAMYKHHSAGLVSLSSLAWAGHLIHVAIPESRGQHVRWDNLKSNLPHPDGLTPLLSGKWNLYSDSPDTANHIFGTSEGAGTAILTFLGGFHPQTQSLWLTDIAHHHLSLAIFIATTTYLSSYAGKVNRVIGTSASSRGEKTHDLFRNLSVTLNNSLHIQLGLALEIIGVITSLTPKHMYALNA
jgi:photosystem I P700 chlorophyll a apoprotein A2